MPVVQKGALPPKLLTPYMANFYRLLVAVGVVGILVGSCGLAVLLDAESKQYWFSNTRFASLWMTITEKNPMATNICLNGGIMALILSYLRLQAHKAGQTLKASKKTK